MEDFSPYDELHALVSGTLSEEDEARLRERCAADPVLAALLEEILEVHVLTGPADVTPPPCRLSFEDVSGALAPQRARRMDLRRTWRVAAAVLVLAVGGMFLSRALHDRADRSNGGEAGRLLRLAEIPLSDEEAPATELEIPETLASYRPVEEGKVHWITSLADAELLARASSRPVLLFLHHPTCPWCLEMRRDTFTDSGVLTLMDRFVPALIDVMKADPETRKLADEGWPWLGVVDSEGALILSFPGKWGPGDFADRLAEAARLAGPPVLEWERVNGLVTSFLTARRAEEDEALSRAHEAYVTLTASAGGTTLASAARRGIARIAGRAREALLRARLLARTSGAGAALTALDQDLGRFAGTPYEGDLRAVRTALATSGSFPVVEGLAPPPEKVRARD